MRVLLTGASGQLGGHVMERLQVAGFEVVAWSGKQEGRRAGVAVRPVELTDIAAVERALTEADPGAIIHAAAMSSIEGVRLDLVRAHAVNVAATQFLADWSARHNRKLVYTSTDLVFDGQRGCYREEDIASPVSCYGRTKLEAEPAVSAVPGGVVARVSLMYGPTRGGIVTFYDRTVAALRRGEPQFFFEDEFRSALDLTSAADILVTLASTDVAGLVHVGGAERLSRFELSRRIAAALGLDATLVKANRQRDVVFPEPRPADVSLDSTRLMSLCPGSKRRSVEQAVAEWV